MGYLLQTVIALAAQVLAEEGLALRSEQPFLVLALAAVPLLLARAARRAALRGRFGSAALCFAALHWSPPVLQVMALCLLGWGRTLERVLGVAPRLLSWPHPVALLALLPFVVYGLLAIDAQARALETRPGGRPRTRGFQARMFLSGLAPLVVYVLATWAIGSNAALRANIEHVALFNALFTTVLVLGFLALLPLLVSKMWDTEPLSAGPRRELLESLARAARFRCREILVWHTGGQVANAAVVGLSPRLRVVLLSDALLEQLQPRETLAVFAHEIGHAKRHHVLVFVCWTAAVFLAVDLALTRWFPADDFLAGLLLLAALGAWYLGFGWLSRRYELDADLYGVELMGDRAAMASALEQVGGPHGFGTRSWRHFSVRDRVAFLARLGQEPALGRQLRRRLRSFALAGVALFVAALAAQASSLLSSLAEDRVAAELALGRFDQAGERLERVAGPDPTLARRVQLAAALARQGGSIDPRALEQAALAALEQGDDTRARDLLELGILRGGTELELLREPLERLATRGAIDLAGLSRLRERLPGNREPWLRALEARAGASAPQ